MPTTEAEYVNITDLLAGILNGYPEGSAIFREYLQNSDDARASKQVFILDERVFPAQSILDLCLNETQGPALVCINDGVLEPADWKALQTIHASSKKTDGSRTGKNGLGFRASYHLTENPHIYSGRKLLILDAHRRFEHHPGGVSMDIIDEGPNFEDQLAPFASFVPDPKSEYTGTIFRLPLRTEAQAKISAIKKEKKPTTAAEILRLFHEFCDNNLEEVILFLKSITSIEFRHIKPDGTETIIGMVTIESQQACVGSVRRRITIKDSRSERSRVWCFQYLSPDSAEVAHVMTTRMGTDVASRLVAEKLSPAISLAYPVEGSSIKGKLFTLLPLPIATGLPVHIDAVFAIKPDRQSLQNPLDVGTGDTREKLLVEWNTMLFECLIPEAWANSIENSVQSDSVRDPWSIWPPDLKGNDNQWTNITVLTLLQIVKGGKEVFPLLSKSSPFSCVSLQDPSILVANSQPDISLEILASLGLRIIQPPRHLYDILETTKSPFKAGLLTRDTVHTRLLDIFPHPAVPNCSMEVRELMVDYLSSSHSSRPTPALVTGIPWFTLSNGSRASLGRGSPTYIIPTTEVELRLFGSQCSTMLTWDGMSPQFRSIISSSPSLNVTTIRPDHIITILKARMENANSVSDSTSSEDRKWLIAFWSWIVHWEHFSLFCSKSAQYSQLHLLPKMDKSIGKYSEKAVVFPKVPKSAVEAWSILGISPLDDELWPLADKMKVVVERPGTTEYVPLLIRSCDLSRQDTLSNDACLAIQSSLQSYLPSSAANDVCAKLLRMRVFMSKSKNEHDWALSSLESGLVIFTSVKEKFPLPIQSSADVYVDMQNLATRSLVTFARGSIPSIQNENTLLGISFQNWHRQSSTLQDELVEWTFRNRYDIHSGLMEQLNELPYVTVNGLSQRVAPKDLINPKSSLCSLYADEDGKFPTNLFASPFYLGIFRELNLVKSAFDKSIVEERLAYFSTKEEDPQRAQKVKEFISFCNGSWKLEFEAPFVNSRSRAWLPINDNTFCSPEECRDIINTRDEHTDPRYYDLTLKILPGSVRILSREFRKALGWLDPLPAKVIVKQFRLTLNVREPNDRQSRLNCLIDYFSHLYDTNRDRFLPADILQNLKDLTSQIPWVPASSAYGRLVRTTHAVFSDDVELRSPFERVRPKYSNFLAAMGCVVRPELSTLSRQLRELDYRSPQHVSAAISILMEIVSQHPNFDRAAIYVPSRDGRSIELDNVYFADTRMQGVNGIPSNRVEAHHGISHELAERLGMEVLSSIILASIDDDDDDDDDIQMSEDLVIRIQGFLRDYDVKYALNEFIANADDAKAKKFAISINKSNPPRGDRYISPELLSLAECDSLVLYNDALLSAADFKGIADVGKGGKYSISDTHGRHGLGALSFYYFTDVATVISGDSILFLDPSGRYLPARKYGKRTAFRKRLTVFMRQYPDQLDAYANMFGFSPTSGNYDGTLFILPLRSSISEKPCSASNVEDLIKESYNHLAESALFFTGLEEIRGEEQPIAGHSNILWKFNASRGPEVSLRGDFKRFDMKLTRQYKWHKGTSETWMVTTSDNVLIPEEHETTATSLKMNPNSPIVVQLAVKFDGHHSILIPSFLFSTVRLPIPTSLPFHVNARFAISSNRQNIVAHTTDAHQRVDAKTSYNRWVLEDVVPPLYLASFEHLLHTYPAKDGIDFYSEHFWLLRPQMSDTISMNVQKGLFARLAEDDEHKLVKQSDGGYIFISFNKAIFSQDEPAEVRRLLRSLRAPSFVCSAKLRRLATIPLAKQVDPQFVKNILLNTEIDALVHLIEEGKIDIKCIAKALEYVHKMVPLSGLPLIVLHDGNIFRAPNCNDPQLYFSADAILADLFHPIPFLRTPFYSKETIDSLLADEATNIVQLSKTNVMDLIKRKSSSLAEDEERSAWISLFWKSYPKLPGPPTISALDGEHIAIVRSDTRSLSLKECVPSKVVFYDHGLSRDWPWISQILHKLNIEVLQPAENEILQQYFSSLISDAVSNILLCLENPTDISSCLQDDKERQQFCTWLRSQLSSSSILQKALKAQVTSYKLLRLPIWEGQTSKGTVLCSASQLEGYLLPTSVDIAKILPLQREGTTVVNAGNALTTFLTRGCGRNDVPTMKPNQILGVLELPHTLTDRQAHDYENLISAFNSQFPQHVMNNFSGQIPDKNGVLRPISELYSDTVSLFVNTLNYTPRSSFVHVRFRKMQRQLSNYGLNSLVNQSTFLHCINSVQSALVTYEAGDSDPSQPMRRPDRDAIYTMAEQAYKAFCDDLPSALMLQYWGLFNNVRFIRPHTSRRQGATFPTDQYCDRRSILLSPSELVVQAHESIAWTQRSLFMKQPSDQLLAVNRGLGVPTAEEVVKHLKVLATRVAQGHPDNSVVLSDLKATYKWLNEHADDARAYLRQMTNDRVFLNVDDPSIEYWGDHWVTASEMLLELHYDITNFKRVKTFLQSYENLLLAAGTEPLKGFAKTSSQSRKSTLFNSEELRATFNSMRTSGELLDVELVPETPSPRDAEMEANLWVHRAFLSACIPHVRASAAGWQTATRIQFPGSATGAISLIEYIYTGEFTLMKPRPGLNKSEAETLLQDILDLLAAADEWGITEFKYELETAIIHTHDLIQKMPHLFDDIMEAAKSYQATRLVDTLNEFKSKNSAIWDQIVEEDQMDRA